MEKRGFEGWYFKHQKGDDTVALIPGRAESGAFIQLIYSGGSRQFELSELSSEYGVICADKCIFSPHGCRIDLPGVSGELLYGKCAPLRSHIMGPFRFLPMECSHSVISMAHTLSGHLTIDGAIHDFCGGMGYIEADSGLSFPKAYTWLQCSSFSLPCSIMVSVAHIPFCGGSFKGCICALLYNGREYRIATYRGCHIHAAEREHICLSQGKLLLEIDIQPSIDAFPLRSPLCGHMTGTIREGHSANIRLRLWERGKLLLDQKSPHASHEYVSPPASPSV